ncbi:MAG TPA: glutathione binding-like protein, partial [Sphingomonas sp.]
EAALQQMDDHLSLVDWFVGDAVSLADIALFAYTHVAGEGGFDLSLYPHIQAWIERLRALPRFIAMDE